MTRLVRIIASTCLLFSAAFVASAQECSILTAADVQKITGTQVKNVPFDSQPGAGGKCANYATSDG